MDKASDQRLLVVLIVAGIGHDDDTQALPVTNEATDTPGFYRVKVLGE